MTRLLPWPALAGALCLLAAPASGQDGAEVFELDPGGFEALDLDDLLSLEVTVASLKGLSVRESPGIVSVITRDEILAMGARDLIDVLRLVPGFFFGVDVQGSVGVGIRGNWAHEGKMLLIIDGQEMNELAYQTLSFGHHYPVETIDRIEIIRGPGSAIYGGNAELGVIKVITRGGRGIRGARASARHGPPRGLYGGDGDQLGFSDVTFEAGNQTGDFEWSVAGFVGRSVRSEGEYVALGGTSGSTLAYDMGKNSEIRPAWVNASARYKGLSARFIYDGYGLSSKDGFDVPTTDTTRYRHTGIYGEVAGDFELEPGLKLMPRLSYKRQRSFWSDFSSEAERLALLEDGTYNQRHVERYRANVTLSWDLLSELNLIAGIEAFYDRALAVGDAEDTREINWFSDGDELVQSLDFFTLAAFAQVLWRNPWVNVTFGGRFERHSEFGASAVPRLALTRVFDNGLHAKLLASQAYRMPGFMNKSLEKALSPDNEISPERTSVLEAELGWTWIEGTGVTANLFYTRIADPIIYFFDETLGAEGYVNRNQTATLGGELEGRWRHAFGQAFLAYAYYQAVGERVPEYEVEGRASLLGAPRHKITGRAIFRLGKRVFLTPTVAAVIGRHAFASDPDEPEDIGAELLVGLTLAAQDVGLPGLGLALIGHDLLDTREVFPQPYAGGHALLPGPGRQILLRISYDYEL